MHIKKFNEINENLLDVATSVILFVAGWKLADYLKFVFRKIKNKQNYNILNTIIEKITSAKIPITEYTDRFFIRVSDSLDLRILKNKTLIITQDKIKDITINLSDVEYEKLLEIIKK